MQHKKFRIGDRVYCNAIDQTFEISDFGFDEEYRRWHYTFNGANGYWFAESTLTIVERLV
jgi:hypothetical protein